jgi:hypothetical protein
VFQALSPFPCITPCEMRSHKRRRLQLFPGILRISLTIPRSPCIRMSFAQTLSDLRFYYGKDVELLRACLIKSSRRNLVLVEYWTKGSLNLICRRFPACLSRIYIPSRLSTDLEIAQLLKLAFPPSKMPISLH